MNYNKSRKEVVRDNQKLIKNLNRRTDNIRKLGLNRNDVGSTAVRRFDELKRNMTRQNLMTDDEILSLNRQLNYINDLKSSTVKGAKEAQSNFQNIKTSIDVLSNEKKDKFWSIYNRAYEENALISDLFKYEMFDFIIDSIYSGYDDDEILDNFLTEFDDVYRIFKGDLHDEQFSKKLSKRLYDNYIK